MVTIEVLELDHSPDPDPGVVSVKDGAPTHINVVDGTNGEGIADTVIGYVV
jgi:hypothetical protein